jgi:hypothetical protein
MHYRNGREAKIGDQIVGRYPMGNLVSGILVKANPGSETCNGTVMLTAVLYTLPLVTLGECVHADDISELSKQEGAK